MREILFRGKRKDNGEWVYGKVVSFWDKTLIVPKSTNTCHKAEVIPGYEVIPETVGQYIGRDDKNGEKIFEGDIVKTKFGRLCIVVWYSSSAHCGWDLQPINTANNVVKTKPPTAIDLYDSENLEVVGNVRDNPELLRD